MDFTEVKSLTIPEGEVEQITDADGNVIWSAISTFSVCRDDSPDPETYQFDDGMTWEDWINSEYNTDGFELREGNIWEGTYYMLEGEGTSPNDVIVNGKTYYSYLHL